MVSFAGLVLEDGTAIYLQIILFIKRAIVAGLINDGDELPSRRFLSSLLGVNP
jgi:GntR family transcriptional regulator